MTIITGLTNEILTRARSKNLEWPFFNGLLKEPIIDTLEISSKKQVAKAPLELLKEKLNFFNKLMPKDKQINTNTFALTEHTESSIKKYRRFSGTLEKYNASHFDEAVNEMKSILPKDAEFVISSRPKSATSIFNRFERRAAEQDIMRFDNNTQISRLRPYEKAHEMNDDGIGMRIILKDASPKSIQKLINSYSDALMKGEMEIIDIRNYKGVNSPAYFSKNQIEMLQEAADINGKKIFVKEGKHTKGLGYCIKDSGYTTAQLKVRFKNGALGEVQIRGEGVHRFSEEREHFFFDAWNGKDITQGIKELEEVFAPLIKAVAKLKKESAHDPKKRQIYDDYRAKIYEYYRNQEQGKKCRKPSLPKGYDPALSDQSLGKFYKKKQQVLHAINKT